MAEVMSGDMPVICLSAAEADALSWVLGQTNLPHALVHLAEAMGVPA